MVPIALLNPLISYELGFLGDSDGKELPAMQETQVQPVGQEKSPGEGNGYPLQYSCVENSMDRGAGGLQSVGSQRVKHNWAAFSLFFPIWTVDLRKTNLALRFASMLRSMRIFCYLFKIVKWLQNKQRIYSKWWYSLRALSFGKKFLLVSGFVSIGPADMTPSIPADFSEIPILVFFQKFGTIRADLIEQMRFKQRLKVIQTLEDTTKRNVVSLLRNGMWLSFSTLPCIPTDSNSCLTD